MATLQHSQLGAIRGVRIGPLNQFFSLPYATVHQRFGRSVLLDSLPASAAGEAYDATRLGPESVQPIGAAKTDAKSNQLPSDIIKEERSQSEDCTRLSITAPEEHLKQDSKLPVVVFFHGGAYFLGSGERPYYSPINFCKHAFRINKPLIYVSVNYRLGALGFFHSSAAPDQMPPNNALHDQLRALEWIHKHIGGFGGDANNITAVGQSAGGESVSLHNISGQKTPLYRRSIAMSGSPMTMGTKTPDEHEANFRSQAQRLGIETRDRTSAAIAEDMKKASTDSIRDLNFIGAPCSKTEILPYDRPKMKFSRAGPPSEVDWLESQIISSSSYDGSISYIMITNNPQRKDHAKTFHSICKETMKHPQRLIDLYDVKPDDPDDIALEKICHFPSDIGFFAAADAVAQGAKNTKTFFQYYDLGNPFEGLLTKEKYATHTWDIVSLLGAYDDRLSPEYMEVIREWRTRIVEYANNGTFPTLTYHEGKGLRVDKGGLSTDTMGNIVSERRRKLYAIATDEAGEDGCDFLWESVCRRFLNNP